MAQLFTLQFTVLKGIILQIPFTTLHCFFPNATIALLEPVTVGNLNPPTAVSISQINIFLYNIRRNDFRSSLPPPLLTLTATPLDF